MPFTFAGINEYVSPRVTEVKVCGASDVLSEFPSALHWISSIGLRSMFHGVPYPSVRHWAIQFVRHIERALVCYSDARTQLLGLVTEHRTQWSPYFRALSYFEDSAVHLYQAFASHMKMSGKRFFKGRDGSPLQRLNVLYNAVKHASAGSEQPIWITDEGLHSEEAVISFIEFEELLRECARSAAAVCRGADAHEG